MESVEAAHARTVDLWNSRDLEGYMEMIHQNVYAICPTIAEPVHSWRALREVTAHLFDSTLSSRVDFEDLKFARYEGVAVVSGVATVRARKRDGTVVTDTSYGTITYVREGSSWKVIAVAYSPVLAANASSAFFA